MEESDRQERGAAGTPAADEKVISRAAADILSRLVIAYKSRLLYAPSHPAVRQAVSSLQEAITGALPLLGEISFRAEREGFAFRDHLLGKDKESLRQLASHIRSLNVRTITMVEGLSPEDVGALVELLVTPPEELDRFGGPEAFLLGRGAHGIRITESEAHRAEEPERPDAGEGTSGTPEDGSEARARTGRNREELEVPSAGEETAEEEVDDLLRLILDPEKLARALSELRDAQGNPLSGPELADAAYGFLKEAAAAAEHQYSLPREWLDRALAESILFLEMELRNRILSRRLIPGLRRESLCRRIMGRFSPQEMAGLLSYLLTSEPELIPSTESLLKDMGYGKREVREIVRNLQERLIELGELAPGMLLPLERFLQKEGGAAGGFLPTAQEIFRLSTTYDTSEVEELQRISETDIESTSYQETTPMLLDLLERGSELDNLDRVVNMLEDNFWGLTTVGQLGPAADILEEVAETLRRKDPVYEPFKAQLSNLLEEAADRELVHRAARLLSERRSDPEAFEDFKRYLATLGESGVAALMEALGKEERMSVRKFILDTLADICRDHLSLLSTYMQDDRWYLVRNIVTVMARIRSPETMPYLRLAMLHPHPKVKAEAVRALGLIGTREATDMIIRGLQDKDERTRILCIRWLGRHREKEATKHLVAMLEEKMPGAESHAVKLEIIHSLGKILDPDSYPVLRKLANRPRFILKAERQELMEAAQESLRRLMEHYPQLEEEVGRRARR